MPKVSFQKLAFASAGAVLYFATIEANPALAATFTVTNTNNSGAGSLRQAVLDANATFDTNTIDFLLGTGPQTITLTSGELEIANNLTIKGLGADLLSVSGRGNSRIFNIDSGALVEISGLTITDGYVPTVSGIGGGILNNGTLTVTDSTISRNETQQGGGIYNNAGTLVVTNSTISNNLGSTLPDIGGELNGLGGGIYSRGGVVIVTNSKISSNGSRQGGAINGSGNLTVTNSTISSNRARFYAAGILWGGTLTVTDSTIGANIVAIGDGGGIVVGGTTTVTNSSIIGNGGGNIVSGTTTVTNSTISGNFGNGLANSGELTVTNSTISGNRGSGLANSGELRVTNSTISNNYTGINNTTGTVNIGNAIVANNNTQSLTKSDVSGNFTSLGYNLIGIGDRSTGFGVIGDIVGTQAAPINPLLGPLQDNGGPTLTLALLPGSPAIDAANPNSFPSTDQRGVSRPQGPRADIGAYELEQTVKSVPEPEQETVALLTVMGLSFLMKKKKAAFP